MILASLCFVFSLILSAFGSSPPVICNHFPTGRLLQDSSCIVLLEDLSHKAWINENITWGQNAKGTGALPARWGNMGCAVNLIPWDRNSDVQDTFALVSYFNALFAIVGQCVQEKSRAGYARVGRNRSVRLSISGSLPELDATLSTSNNITVK